MIKEINYLKKKMFHPGTLFAYIIKLITVLSIEMMLKKIMKKIVSSIPAYGDQRLHFPLKSSSKCNVENYSKPQHNHTHQ